LKSQTKLELKAAETFYEELQKTHLENLNVGLIHGRMSWQEKEEKMLLFLKKEFDVLISTTVIEVGIDIPDANIILITMPIALTFTASSAERKSRTERQAGLLCPRDEG